MTVNDPSEPTTLHENNTTHTKTSASLSSLFVPPVHPIRRLRPDDPDSDSEHYDAVSISLSSNIDTYSNGDTFSNRDTLSDTDTTDTTVEEDKQRAATIHLDASIIGTLPIILPIQAEDRLSVEILELFESLLPTQESHDRRTRFVHNMERILNTEWPGHDIKVHLFGSSMNELGTSNSDVDICVTTPWNGLKDVNVLAKGLKKHGMKRVFCVPKAKVPIVRLWDPQLNLACDINVNNTLALQNTRLIKAYVQIDPRIRPFAMIIKHWARRRVLNDAASGGTLSTYTWTCIILNFLQMRCPPILPSLHAIPHELAPDNVVINDLNSSFFEDVGQLKGYGEANKESLGGLLYAFFRRYAVEFNYNTQVVSVRHGRYLTKAEKGWDDITSRMYRVLCVEEPFNTTRNLGNSADDISVAGVREEFCRALDIMCRGGSLDEMVEQYMFPPSFSRSMPLNLKREFYVSPPPMPKYLPTIHSPFGASSTQKTNDFHDVPIPPMARNGWAQRSRSVEPSVSSSSSSSSSPSHHNHHMNPNDYNGHRHNHFQQSHYHQQPQHNNNVNSATRRIPAHHQQNNSPRRPYNNNNNNYFRTQSHRYDNPSQQENEKEVSIDSVGEFPFLPGVGLGSSKSTKIETQDRRPSVSLAGVVASEKKEDKQIEFGERKKLGNIQEVKATTVLGNNSIPKAKRTVNTTPKLNTPLPSVSTPLQDQTSKKKSKKNVNLEEKTQIPGAYFVNKSKLTNRRQDENTMPSVSSSTPAHIFAKKNAALTEQRQQSVPENGLKEVWQTTSLKRKKKKEGGVPVDQNVTKKEEELKSSASSGNDTVTASSSSKKKKSRSSSIAVNSHELSDLPAESSDTVKALTQKIEEVKNGRPLSSSPSTSFMFPQPPVEEWKVATSGRKKKKNTTDNSIASSQAN